MKETLYRNRYVLIICASVLVLLGAWELIARVMDMSLVLPTFSAVFVSFIGLFARGTFYSSLFATVLRSIIGYIIGFAAGVMLGIIAGRYKAFAAALQPIVAFMRATPVAAITLLLYIWVGSNILPPIIGIMLIFPIIYQQVKTSVECIDPSVNDVLSEMGSGFLHSARTVYLPMVLPHTVSGISSTFGMNLKAVITAEVLASSVPSIGRQIYFANQNLIYEVNTLFAWVLVAVLVSILFEALLRLLCGFLTKKISWLGVA